MAGMLIQIGQRVMQVDPARAMELVRSGVARMLPPGMQTAGSQAAGAQASGPFYGGFTTNLPPALQRPGLVGRGAAGAIGAGAMALGGGGETPRNPMFDERDRRGTAGAQQPSTLMDQIMQERSSAPSPFGTLSPVPPTSRAPMMMSAPPLMMTPPAPSATSPFGTLSPMEPGSRAPMMMADPLPPIPPSGIPPIQPTAPVNETRERMFGSLVGIRPVSVRPMDSTLFGEDMPVAPPLPPARPANIGAPTQLASAAPSVRESFMQRLLSGPNYQSNSMPVVPQAGAQSVRDINWGDAESAADFFRAERALMGLPEDALRVAGLLG